MFSEVVKGVDAMAFETALTEAREAANVAVDSDLDEAALRALVERFLDIYPSHTGERFPEDPQDQLRLAVQAVFESWNNERAVTYRRLNGIPDDLGTAVTVQRMVFGNLGPSSGAGVAFTRDPTDGSPRADGDFLVNAQGEDVVAGVRNTEDLDGLARRMPEIHAELLESLRRLERHYRDIQDVEYTVEEGRLFILQTRSAKRHALAAVRFAVDAVAEGLLDREEALRQIDPGSLGALLHPSFDPADSPEELTRGVPASPGAAQGRIVLSADEAETRAAAGEDVILVRHFHLGRRRRRLPCRAGDPHRPGWEVLPCGDSRAGDGAALRLRRHRSGDRSRSWIAANRRPRAAPRRRDRNRRRLGGGDR